MLIYFKRSKNGNDLFILINGNNRSCLVGASSSQVNAAPYPPAPRKSSNCACIPPLQHTDGENTVQPVVPGRPALVENLFRGDFRTGAQSL